MLQDTVGKHTVLQLLPVPHEPASVGYPHAGVHGGYASLLQSLDQWPHTTMPVADWLSADPLDAMRRGIEAQFRNVPVRSAPGPLPHLRKRCRTGNIGLAAARITIPPPSTVHASGTASDLRSLRVLGAIDFREASAPFVQRPPLPRQRPDCALSAGREGCAPTLPSNHAVRLGQSRATSKSI
jgi:hypothetical protein